jgi:hypothetical protein
MDEKQRILKMVEEGKMSAGEALELLEALGEVHGKETPETKPKGRKKMLRIRIDAGEKGSGKAKVNVNLPLSVAKKLTSLTKVIPESAKTEMEKEGFNIDELNLKELIEAIEDGELDENLVDIVADEEDGKAGATVKIYVD